jgi:hypothetical protein
MTTATLAALCSIQTPYTVPLSEIWRLTQIIVRSGLFKGQSEHLIFATILTGIEMGLSPMKALRTLQMPQGRPLMPSAALVGVVKQSAVCAYFMMVESDPKYAIYETRRQNDPAPTRHILTLEDTELTGREKNTASVLRDRCAVALARLVYPDITMGIECSETESIGSPEILPTVSLPKIEPVLLSREELSQIKVEPRTSTPKEEVPLSFSDKTKGFLLEDLYKRANSENSLEQLRALVKVAQNATKERIFTQEQLGQFIEHCKKLANELKKRLQPNMSARVREKLDEIEHAKSAPELENLRLWFEGIELTQEEEATVTAAFHVAWAGSERVGS